MGSQALSVVEKIIQNGPPASAKIRLPKLSHSQISMGEDTAHTGRYYYTMISCGRPHPVKRFAQVNADTPALPPTTQHRLLGQEDTVQGKDIP